MPKPEPFSFEAIGTHWWVESLDKDRPLSTVSRSALRDKAREFDALYSRFRSDSLVGILNSTRELAHPPGELLDMLRFCEEMYLVSHGAFNITVGGTLHSLGYGKRSGSARVHHDIWQHIRYDSELICLPAETTIDTGGFGKGWLIDAFADLLRAHGYQHFLINGGGDIYIDAAESVEIALEHPYDAGLIVGSTKIQKGALAVSGTAKRSWEHDGERYHHLIDPVTETSVNNGIAGTYVQAPSALVADTMATILIIRPDLVDELSERYGLKAVIVRDDQL